MARERLGSVKIGGRKYALSARINRPSELSMRINRGIGTYSIDVSTRGLAGGQKFGGVEFVLNRNAKTARIKYINSAQSLKGQGIGNRLYARAMLEAKEQGATKFTSDARVSKSAVGSWENLRKKLPAGSVTRSATEDQSTQLYAASGAVFSVDLTKISKSTLRNIAEVGGGSAKSRAIRNTARGAAGSSAG